MYRRAFARHRTGAALLLGLSLRAPSASAYPEEPLGGFDEKATRAPRELLFEPPLRAGVPVPARIRYRYILEVPDATLVGPVTDAVTGLPVAGASLQIELDGAGAQRASTLADGSLALPALGGGTVTVRVESSRHLAQQTNVQLVPADEARVSFALSPRAGLPGVVEAALEVTVRGQRSAPGVSSSTREEGRRIPGAFGDPFRAVEALPGVTPVASGLPHFDRVDLYPGGYPARFRRFAGGVVSSQTRGPDLALSREANLRQFDVGGLIETPFARGRGSLLPALLSLLSHEVKLDYRDYQAGATYEPSARDRFSVFGFGSYDLRGEKRNGILRRLGDACRPRITFTW